MTAQPNHDHLGPEEYARRLQAGDEILYLPEAAVFVRKPIAKGLDPFIRVSCGRDEDLDVFADALPGALADARRSP